LKPFPRLKLTNFALIGEARDGARAFTGRTEWNQAGPVGEVAAGKTGLAAGSGGNRQRAHPRPPAPTSFRSKTASVGRGRADRDRIAARAIRSAGDATNHHRNRLGAEKISWASMAKAASTLPASRGDGASWVSRVSMALLKPRMPYRVFRGHCGPRPCRCSNRRPIER